MTPVILFGEYDDEDIRLLCSVLEDLGAEVIFFALGLPSDQYSIQWDIGKQPVIESDGVVIDHSTVRRSRSLLFKCARMDERVLTEYSNGSDSEIAFAHREWDTSLLNAIESLIQAATYPTYGSPRNLSWHHWKPFALHTAAELGIPVPETVLSNRPTSKLWHGVVAKAVNSNALIEPGRFFPTSRLDSEILKSISGERLEVPSVFQEEIIRDYEIRTVVLGANAYERSVRSPTLHVDIKYAEETFTSGVPRSLRTDALVHLASSLGITFCCFDTMVDMKGCEWLVDITPRGSWHYYESPDSLELSTEIANLLYGTLGGRSE
jgi:hypothetical protein